MKNKRLDGFRRIVTGAGLGTLLALVAACEGGSGGSAMAGGATIRGLVVSYETSQALFVPVPAPSRWERAVAMLSDVFVTPAQAAVGGVRVVVVGTDLSARTASDGLFVISGVPQGRQVLEFLLDDSTASLGLIVPESSSIDLGSVRIQNGSVSTDPVRITQSSSTDRSGDDDNGADDSDADDNEGDVSDDDAIDGVVSDDDGANDDDANDDDDGVDDDGSPAGSGD